MFQHKYALSNQKLIRFFKCHAEQTAMQNDIFLTQSRNRITEVMKFVNQYHMFLKIHFRNL